MKTWTLVVLTLIGAVAVMLIYPGIPVGAKLVSYNSASSRSSTVTCYSLHWDGVHSKFFDFGDASATSNAVCWGFK